jgi:HEAT repeat protein
MRRTARHGAAALVWGLLLGLGGCSATDWNLMAWMNPQPTPNPSGEATPAESIAELRRLAQSAAKESPEEQQRMSALLAQSLRNELDPLVRAQTVRTLGAYRTTSADVGLVAGLADTDSDVRIAACETWGKRGGAEAAKRLTEIVATDTDIDVRLAATRGLGMVGDASAIEGLSLALDDPNPAMQYRAVRSLEKVTGRYHGQDVAAWKADLEDGQVDPPSLAERLRQLF